MAVVDVGVAVEVDAVGAVGIVVVVVVVAAAAVVCLRGRMAAAGKALQGQPLH